MQPGSAASRLALPVSAVQAVVRDTVGVEQWRVLAAADNAAWCDVVCRAHGCETRFEPVAWTSSRRTPVFYPDAVTLVPDPPLMQVLSRLDMSIGCSIKDSFAALDLTRYGFRVLVEAEWILHTRWVAPVDGTGARWEVVRDAPGLLRWQGASRVGDRPSGVVPAMLLDDGTVMVLAGYVGSEVVSGAVLHRSAAVVGLSNFFADPADVDASWAGCLAFAHSLSHPSPLVGYESGDALTTALRHGFDPIGPLRIWIADH